MCDSCASGTSNEAVVITEAAADRADYTVTGMTCGHCVSSVTEEVSGIEGVSDVRVDLASGSLSFASDREISRDAVEEAVREAGYQLA